MQGHLLAAAQPLVAAGSFVKPIGKSKGVLLPCQHSDAVADRIDQHGRVLEPWQVDIARKVFGQLLGRHVVTARDKIPGRDDVGALRLRMIGAKNVELAKLPDLGPGEKNESVVLDLDYSVLIPRRQKP